MTGKCNAILSEKQGVDNRTETTRGPTPMGAENALLVQGRELLADVIPDGAGLQIPR